MSTDHYLDWNRKRIKGIIDFYKPQFIYMKTVCDNGAFLSDIGGALHRLGADVTAIDIRQDHLKIAAKKFPSIKMVKHDLDRSWPFVNKHFDIILDLDIMCHLMDCEKHLRDICASATHLVLETTVCDSDNPFKVVKTSANKNLLDSSANGVTCRPSPAFIERVLQECGMSFRRLDQDKFNSGSYVYDWIAKNNEECDINKRRIWFAVKNGSPIKLAPPHNPIKQNIINQASVSEPIRNEILTASKFSSIKYPVPLKEKKFVIVIPSYNNEKWVNKNITSAINQDYDKYRIIFTDDCSTDNTFNIVKTIVDNCNKKEKITLIKNDIRKGALENIYNMIYSCADDEIILTLDGDDWLAHNNVLNRLDQVYSSDDIWSTYGQYQNYPDGANGVAERYPDNIINSNTFRSYRWCASHLRTFYTWIFKQIKKEDLMKDGKFLPMTWDLGFMIPICEMSGFHARFLSDILYIYNLSNDLNDHKINKNLQQNLDRYVRSLPKYQKLNKSPLEKTANVGLLLIATGKYDQFLKGIIESADRYFLKDMANVTYYIFTDSQNIPQTSRKTIRILIEHKTFPYASMDRFKHFVNNKERLGQEDYLYYVDVDSLFVDKIGDEICGNLVCVQHCGYTDGTGPFESNQHSCLFVDRSRYKRYVGGGFSGGHSKDYLELAQWCYEAIEKDLSNGVMPSVHDESVINRYFVDHEPDVVLTPEFHYPASNLEHYKKKWGNKNYKPHILLLDKNHQEVRS